MIIGAIIAVCIILLILAFLLPRLSSGPQKGVDRTLGVGQRAGARPPGRSASCSRSPSAPRARRPTRAPRRAARVAASCPCKRLEPGAPARRRYPAWACGCRRRRARPPRRADGAPRGGAAPAGVCGWVPGMGGGAGAPPPRRSSPRGWSSGPGGSSLRPTPGRRRRLLVRQLGLRPAARATPRCRPHRAGRRPRAAGLGQAGLALGGAARQKVQLDLSRRGIGRRRLRPRPAAAVRAASRARWRRRPWPAPRRPAGGRPR